MILDIVFVIILILSIMGGYRRGFIRSILGFGTTLIALALSYVFYAPYVNFMWTAPGISGVTKTIQSGIAGSIRPFVQDTIASGTASDFPSIIAELFKVNQAAGTVVDAVATLLTNIILLLVFILLIKVVLKLAIKLIDMIAKIPVIKQANSLLGACVGVISGMLLCYLVAALIMVMMLNSDYGWLRDITHGAYISNHFLQNNLILNLIVGTSAAMTF